MAKIIEDAREKILRAARDIAAAQGTENLCMRAVAQSCGLALGTIYNYFPTKTDLLLELMAGMWDEFLAEAAEEAAREPDFFAALHGVYTRMQACAARFKAAWLTPPFYRMPGGVQRGLVRERDYFSRLAALLTQLLERARDSGQIAPKKSVPDTARFILLNFMAMARQPSFSYELFEEFLKELV